MRILFLTQLLPLPVDAGPKTRAYYVLAYLAAAGHEVTLLSFVRPGDRKEDIDAVRRVCRSVEVVPLRRSRITDALCGLRSVISATPFIINRDLVAEMSRTAKRILGARSFDALHADQLWMAPYGLGCAGANLRVLDQHNAVHMVFRRMCDHQRNAVARAYLRQEASKVEAFERTACSKFDHVVWVSEEDRRALSPARNGRESERVIPIAIDPAARRCVRSAYPFRVTFVGGMHWPPNAEGVSWFVQDIWPAISRAAPHAVLTVIGKHPPRAVQAAADRARVTVTGYVTDLDQYLSETAVFVVPLLSGSGMRVKLLDAWAAGLPVVSTSLGVEGIRAKDGDNLLLADHADSFAECVIRVIQDQTCARRLSANGRATVETLYDWRKVYPAWDEIYH